MNKLTLYADASKGGKKQWSIWIEEDRVTVTVEWGIVGGTLQTSSDEALPKGRPGTKSYKNAVTVAQENYDRQVRKKREEGYLAADEKPAEVDYLKALDKNFVPAKPVNKEPEDYLKTLDEAGQLWIQRKRDGRRHLILITNDVPAKVRIYSRRMEELTDHMPKLRDAILNLGLPVGTLLDGEVIVVNPDGSDNFRAVGKFTNPATKPEEAAAVAAQFDVRFMVFDVLYYSQSPSWQLRYDERYRILLANLPVDERKPVHVAEIINYRREHLSKFNPNLRAPLHQLQDMVKREGWEGLILWERMQPSVVKFGGKPKRCNAIKWKPIQEGDFIATGYYLGSGEWSDVVGGFHIQDIDPETGERRDCGKVGTGFDADTRKEALSWEYPCVIEVKYDKQEPTAKLRFPVFVRKRDDKGVEECIGRELEADE